MTPTTIHENTDRWPNGKTDLPPPATVAIHGGRGRSVVASRRRNHGVAHARTLVGAIDDHLGYLVHDQPWLIDHRTTVLEDLAEEWLGEGHANWLPDLDINWVAAQMVARSESDRDAVEQFLRWAALEGIAQTAWEASERNEVAA